MSNAKHTIDPYLTLAADYGWANAMTNRGPSYPAHQFIFGGTSAPSAQTPRTYRIVPAPLDAAFFIHDTRPAEPPDTD